MADPHNKDYESNMQILENEKVRLDKQEERFNKVIKWRIKEKETLILEREILEETNGENDVVDRRIFDQVERNVQFASAEVQFLVAWNNSLQESIDKWKKEVSLYEMSKINEERRRRAAEREMENLKEQMQIKNRELREMKVRKKK